MIIDIVTIVLLLIVGIVNFIGGFSNGCLKNILTVASIGVMIIVAPILVDLISPMFSGLGESVNSAVGEMVSFDAGNLVVKIISYLIVCAGLGIVLWILCAIIRKILLSIFKPKGVLKIIDRIAGLVVSIAIYGVLFLGIYALVVQIPVEALQSIFADSKIMQINFLVEPLKGVFGSISGAGIGNLLTA
ncbi:MAG: CvpA family protein [Clostridia bacterium]|nr:CvpA family protein [Clostridia bacterium]